MEKLQKNSLVLTGFMGTGKSSAGRIIARMLGARFIDIDHEIKNMEGLSIDEIFSKHGEDYFRSLETSVIRRLSSEGPAVIATGGGAVLKEENMKSLRHNGVIICLTADPEIIYARVSGSKSRPLLNTGDPAVKIKDMLASRAPFYSKADIIIDTSSMTPVETAEEVIKKFKEFCS
ncbi:MAG: shikimate kinase [Dissulfurispiraceae bacterium]|jgi:shikimate kinase|nr:shikimate kinase [Dissulfurispiraceae bacterium]